MTEKTDKPIQIGELAKQLGITTRTIRYYEELGLMGPTQRPEGGTRSYQRDDVLRLKFILKMKELGLTLKEMQELARNFDINQRDFHTITPRLLDMLDFHIKKIDRKVASLTSLKSEIVQYRARILDILDGKAPVVR